ncbi:MULTISPECIES: hypothetical protein [Aerococcus]|uniref:Phage protein n=1 Tax=Aerococcus tenax TaxID=3078812 RepID=A0A329N906_9LACT|nr:MULTISPECIES: hypothetical protein [Aerococcus]MDL5184717.1 hypothetical protein [Aerococcus mictus]KAA9238578.1 hypothetical protein F6I34_08005 [Aerococcus urinae]MDK6371993.1 hypothetical protein [Aerococcus urinae]MDK7302433.1 hypothetical protein [Aerococcus urinae]MDK7802292.1 hypothetical protein [Aerococcus urinae]
MGKFKFKLNKSGVRELMQSGNMQGILSEHANQVAKVANSSKGGYEVSSYIGRNRANVSVYAKTVRAKRDNSKNNTLLKALGSAKK